MRAIRALSAGGPEVLEVVDLPDLVAGPGELVVHVAAAGVNFIDTYQRSGLYPMPFPYTPGLEGAGTVMSVGWNPSDSSPGGFVVGERVAWDRAAGSYAEQVVVRADRALHVPVGVADRTAAALPLQGITAHYLATSTFPIAAGQDVLIHAAAGGVGLLLTQLAVARGARVIGTVSTPAKAVLAREAGAADVIQYTEMVDLARDLPAAVRDLTNGAGVHVAYDGVGKDTFDGSLAAIRVRGMLVVFGASSGPVPAVELQRLNAAGSVFVTRPKIDDYTATRDELNWRANELFSAVLAGTLRVRIGATYPLSEAAEAHRALESRATTGKVLLIP